VSQGQKVKVGAPSGSRPEKKSKIPEMKEKPTLLHSIAKGKRRHPTKISFEKRKRRQHGGRKIWAVRDLLRIIKSKGRLWTSFPG